MPLLSILGALGLAAWSVYWDLRRRLPRPPQPMPPERSAASAVPVRDSWRLQGAIALLASAWMMRYLSDRWGAWLVLVSYAAFVVGISLLALYVARRLSALLQEPEGE